MKQEWEQKNHTVKSESHPGCLPCTISAPEFAVGVTGNECVALVDEANRILLRERDLEVEGLDVEGLSTEQSDGKLSGTIRTVLSLSCEPFLALKLSKLFIVDLTLAEFGLGGSPLLEPGLDINVGPSVFVKEDNAFSTDLAGICREERCGLLDSRIKEVLSPIPFPAQH
ncbi:hypothetical protein V8G54_033665 [Vigna mungo]|uniref:Uncharacterized protein n=1 Tax=Vigna mungo TaxID=3915 RepID=A0AAQ3MNT8_VIGMU